MNKCIRCDKVTDGVHTCTPSKSYSAGIIEGLKLARDKIDMSYDSNRMALFNSYGYHEEVLNMINELIIDHCPYCDGDGYIVVQVAVDEYGDAITDREQCSCTLKC